MVNEKIIVDHLNRLGLEDYNISEVEVDESGDYVKCLLPDLDFEVVKSQVFKNKYYKKHLNDFTIDMLNFRIIETINGYKTLYRLYIKKEKFGVSFSVLVKRIDYYNVFGEYVPVISYEMLKDMKNKDIEDLERFKVK